MKIVLRFLTFVALAWALPLSAQTTTSGTIVGRVTDAGGKVALDGVRVAVDINGTSRATTTDQQGGYVLVNVPAGEVSVLFNYLGLPAQTRPVSIGVDRVVRLD